MSGHVVLSHDEVASLKHFHAQHFPDQPIPIVEPSYSSEHVEVVDQQDPSGGTLGYYDDGVQRTLTVDQIAMFRNSEIQQSLAKRRRAREQEEENNHKKERKARRDAQKQSHQPQRTFGHEDDSTMQSLMYDEEPSTQQSVDTNPKTFKWPKLGQ